MTKINEVEKLARELQAAGFIVAYYSPASLNKKIKGGEAQLKAAEWILQHYHPKVEGEVVVKGKIRGSFDEGTIYDIDYPLGGYDYGLQKALRGFNGKQVEIIVRRVK